MKKCLTNRFVGDILKASKGKRDKRQPRRKGEPKTE
nr:MAG TPA: hypothetical protein [Caudoviricetes sp.]